MSEPRNWKAVQMGSEGWTIFRSVQRPSGRTFDMTLASNLTEADAKLIAEAPALEAKLEAMRRLQEASVEFYCGMIDKAAWREAVRQSPKGQELMALAAQQERR